jgi:hypothetical protein
MEMLLIAHSKNEMNFGLEVRLVILTILAETKTYSSHTNGDCKIFFISGGLP